MNFKERVLPKRCFETDNTNVNLSKEISTPFGRKKESGGARLGKGPEEICPPIQGSQVREEAAMGHQHQPVQWTSTTETLWLLRQEDPRTSTKG